MPEECIPSHWVCDGEEDCTNGRDENFCSQHLEFFKRTSGHRLNGYDVEKWLNTPPKTCALRCKEAEFTCRSFSHKAKKNLCLLSNNNVGTSGALEPAVDFDYYELIDLSMNCDGMFVCGNNKCINQSQVCDGKNDCGDRSDEDICNPEKLNYAIRLSGSENDFEGRVEVKILGQWGQVCDDGFGMNDATVICKELGFNFGALAVRPGGYFGNLEPPTRFMVDQLKCRGNETSLRECDFDGWGVHDCSPEEAVGVVCKTAVNTCPEGQWKCDNSPFCISTPFICDQVPDCPDGSDESPEHCDAPFEIRLANGSRPSEGRVEIRHHGVWGTICDDDFTKETAKVICRSLGYGGNAVPKKNSFFGPGQGPIWLDEVSCDGNETQIYRCEHHPWGESNCNHEEDAGVICQEVPVNIDEDNVNYVEPEINIDDILPAECGRRAEYFNNRDDIFEKVISGSIAPKGSYPWQASIRVRGHNRSNHWCGAVVISPLHVLTAAHCLEGYNKGTYFVRAGDYNTEIPEDTEVNVNIEDYYIHEEFRKGHRMNNDIALVLLKGRGIPLNEHIVPICLPPTNVEYPAGLNCTISGFGSIETGSLTHSRDLRFGWIPLIDQSICRAEYVYGEGAISNGMICAGYLDEGIDACDGDSGGPLACKHDGVFTLYGITSWGQHCGAANKPGVYVRISHYRDWIDKKIRESLSGR
ncbi:neurotrypsin-like [Chelonus insularis]|uniref:neurotrypsin-like n=1 Tax=Chelonus insularis TaxID=460826 RepID=UPI00158DEC5D|nr:neurotrypsin-like [Chelonus insularis]